MTGYGFAWRERVADPDWLVYCAACAHAEQVHDIGGCTAGPHDHRCICDEFAPGKRQWVGISEPPRTAA